MSVAAKGFKDLSRRAYVAAGPFNANFYTYTTTTATTGVVTGTLTPVLGATPQTCPAGRVLRETGRKLYPGDANPGIFTPMVSVYDNISLLTGFIDPNSPLFAVYSTDVSYFEKTGVNPATGLTDIGPPVVSLGPIVGSLTEPALYLPGFTKVPYNNSQPNADVFINPALGNTFEINSHKQQP
jgi:hypothetical protein